MYRLLIIIFCISFYSSSYADFESWNENGHQHISNVPRECIKVSERNTKYVDSLCLHNSYELEKKLNPPVNPQKASANTSLSDKSSTNASSNQQKRPVNDSRLTRSSTSFSSSNRTSLYDLSTSGEKYHSEAEVYCPKYIEKYAKYDVRWEDGWLGSKFSQYAWIDQSKNIMAFLGDKAKFQNGFGAWQNVIYSCYFNVSKREFIGAEVIPGKL